MSAICKCYRCGSHLTMSEALENWCLTCTGSPQLLPVKVEARNECRASRPSPERGGRS